MLVELSIWLAVFLTKKMKLTTLIIILEIKLFSDALLTDDG